MQKQLLSDGISEGLTGFLYRNRGRSMNIENKKKAIGEDSVLYQKRDDSLGRKDISALSRGDKWQYFKDYYLMKVIAAALCLIMLGNLVYNMVFKQQEHIISIAVVDECFITDTEDMCEYLHESLGMTKDTQMVSVANYSLSDPNQQMAFSTRYAAEDTDIILCNSEYFKQFAAQGFFCDLKDFLPEDTYESLKDRMMTGRISEFDIEGNVVSEGMEAEYGINISGNETYSYFEGYSRDVILGISMNTQSPEYVLQTLDILLNSSPAGAGGSAQAE